MSPSGGGSWWSATCSSPPRPPVDHRAVTAELARALDTWDGPGILIIAGNLFDLTGPRSPLADAERSMRAHPALRDRRSAGSSMSTNDGSSARPGPTSPGTTTTPRRSPPSPPGASNSSGRSISTSTRPAGSGWCGSSRASTPTPPGAAGPRPSSIRRPTPSPGSSGRPRPGRGWRSLAAQSTEDAPVAGRARPAERPVGPVPVRGLPHPVPASRPLRLVAARPLRRGRPAPARRGHAVGPRPPRFGAPGPGHPPRPPGRPGATRSGRRLRRWPSSCWPCWPWCSGCSAGGCGRSSAAGPSTRCGRKPAANDTARDAGRRLVGRGLCRPDHRGHLPVGAHPPRRRLLRQRRGHRPRWSRSTGAAWGCRRSSSTASGSAGSSSRPAPSSTSACCWPATTCRSPSVLERAWSPGDGAPGASTPRWWRRIPVGDVVATAPDLRKAHRRTRRVRRWASAAILFAGVIDLLDAVTPPLRGRLHVRAASSSRSGASVAAGALIAMAGLALVALGRGILRGQTPGLAGGRRPPVGHDRPPPRRRRRRRGVAGRPGRPGPPGRQPAGLPGRLGLVVAALGPHRPGGRGGRHHPAHHRVHRALHPHRPRPHAHPHPLVDGAVGGVRAPGRHPDHRRCPSGPTGSWPRPCWPSGCRWWPSPCSCSPARWSTAG